MNITLGMLLKRVPGAKLTGNPNAVIKDIVQDSREVTEGALFVAIEGLHVDGHKFIPKAIEDGAAAVLSAKTPEEAGLPKDVSVLTVPDMDAALKAIVPWFYDYPAVKMRMVGITGTNGKTTTSYLVRHLLQAAGHRVGLIGTIQNMIDDEVIPTHNTTPNIIDLQRLLARMYKAGITHVVMEVSSHALDMGRVEGCEYDTAAFSNLTQDHLDYHGTMENYCMAKAKLFASLSGAVRKPNKKAVVNIDDPAGQVMLDNAKCGHITYSVKDESASLRAVDIKLTGTGASFAVQGEFGQVKVNLRITGLFNVYNVLAAFGCAMAEGVPVKVMEENLPLFKGVPGRFEAIDMGQNFGVVVDYSHTPDGLENVLRAAREIAEKRVIVVFGCGGDRDRTKRPIMGRIAAELADIVIVTSDNPRSEDPDFIVSEIVPGVEEKIAGKRYEVLVDRHEAIFRAVKLAEDGDMVVIAGKGHEDYQILKDKTIHFDDREQAREALMGGAL
ncbi:MAG: UDP-N-acetylmuramoyl-L-alanyl-D-glutamate--2,6-diaminopimelate ligase [Selenomonadaceae bacterium]|nr:UDP-N-acetylmuramoyl-L-alanyl-D-glutamate--2,6-diaminopimelate ligase [Selenomonadaceae bacterium]